MRKIPTNILPKFSQYSKPSKVITNIIEDTLNNPLNINFFPDKVSSNIFEQISPYNNKFSICKYKLTSSSELDEYLTNYSYSKESWRVTPWEFKKEIFLRAADLIETKYYDKMLAYTMLSQNKSVFEAEIDSICELVDFLRFNVYYTEEIMDKQPVQTNEHLNISEYHPLNGFVASITPFNFTAIAGNLATVPLFFGNSVIWKPSDSSILSNYLFYEILIEAGLPPGVLNFCPMDPLEFSRIVTKHHELGAVLFTGSTSVLEQLYTKIGESMSNYKNFPRIIGESGGKNFHLVDVSYEDLNTEYTTNNLPMVITKTLEGSFNFSGQKCSACSILYTPQKLMSKVINYLKTAIPKYLSGSHNYGVINKESYLRLIEIIENLKNDPQIEFVLGGSYHNQGTYFIEPCVVICTNHHHPVFHEEFFGPILAIYPYDNLDQVIEDCLHGNKYALTGSIFSQNEDTIERVRTQMAPKTGNFYINDKCTGAVVGQQPFGGSAKSGTNDKAGDINLISRLYNQRNIKINYQFSK